MHVVSSIYGGRIPRLMKPSIVLWCHKVCLLFYYCVHIKITIIKTSGAQYATPVIFSSMHALQMSQQLANVFAILYFKQLHGLEATWSFGIATVTLESVS